MKCSQCEAPLTGGTDTFGNWRLPLCHTCYFEHIEEEELTMIADDPLINVQWEPTELVKI